jgi:cytochrome c biogenesis protein CcdA
LNHEYESAAYGTTSTTLPAGRPTAAHGASTPRIRRDGDDAGTVVTATLVGALVTASVLGVTHAVEPDHVAGIASLTGRFGDARLSALVGACFSLGHVALVVGWLGVGSVLLRQTTFPPAFDIVGSAGVAIVLGLLGTTLAVGGLRRLRHAHTHEHDGTVHTHAHVHLPLLGGHDPATHDADATHDHDHTLQAYLKTGVVGALFTLSPPLSMIAFSSTLFSADPDLVVVAVVVYAVSITVTMSALGAGAGAVFERTSRTNRRVHGGVQALAGVLVVGTAVTVLVGLGPLPV